MSSILICLVAAFFAGMGLVALLRPERVLAIFGTRNLSRDGRNEVRAVYGGFGLVIAGLLFGTLSFLTPLRDGILLTVAISLLGMAAGRLVSTIIDGSPGRQVWLIFAGELLMAAMLLRAT